MVLGVMSDTHGNAALMYAAAKAMTADWGASVIFHLGDTYADAELLSCSGYDVRKVPGLWCPEYADGRVPRRRIETFDGLTVACAHAEKDLRHVERAAAIVLLGHTHCAAIEQAGRSLYLNPGHLTNPSSRGQRASYGIIDIAGDVVHGRIADVSGRIRAELTVARDRLAHARRP